MKPAVELDELIERIRHGAERENGLASPAAKAAAAPSELPPVPESVLPPPSPPLASATTGDAAARPESLLDQAAAWVQNARQKNTVPTGVPKLLRPLYRNQGGFNSVLLEAVERLVEVNRALRQQNFELHERMMYFDAWAHGVAETGAENRDWMQAAAARLEAARHEQLERHDRPTPANAAPGGPPADAPVGDAGALEQMQARLGQLAAHAEATDSERRALNDHLIRLRAQLGEQSDHIRTVHHHLDQLGAHVETVLNRRDRSA